MTNPDPDDDEDDRRLAFLLALAAVAVVVVLGLFLLWKIWQNEQLQECVLSGRRDCASIRIQDSR
ncbi:MAG: hypothetical protein ACREHF_13025 [Rhizomicrobium sp.]